MTDGGSALALLRTEFAAEIQSRIDRLEAALVEPDLSIALAQAHRLKGSALVLGLDETAAAIKVIEEGLRAIPPDRHRAATSLADARAASRRELGETSGGEPRSTPPQARHDLTTPLNVVVGYAHLLQEADLGPREREYVDAILVATTKLTAMIQALDTSAPAAAAPFDPAPLVASPHPPAGSRDCSVPTVLVIEDDAANVRLIERLFERRPAIRLLVARTGAEGLELTARDHPDLVLLDLGLDDIPGTDVLRRIKAAISPGTPVVVVSGEDSVDLRRELLHAGATGFLPKPIAIDGLLQLLDQLHVGPGVAFGDDPPP